MLSNLAAHDDVFNPSFVDGGVLLPYNVHPGQSKQTISQTLDHLLASKSARILWIEDSTIVDLPEGPYFLQGKNLHQAWRLYSDEFSSFTAGVVPNDDEDGGPYRFQPLQAGGTSGLYGAVAVPSRLYFPLSQDKPLNGLRVALKDNFHLDGTYTTLGSRAYTELYGTQNTTAQFVKTLIDQGAQIVGKTKLSAFATAEVPPEKTIDYLAPFNPRGDGYQGPSGSSSGAGSSIASYDWLDVSLGTDTSGSIRMPAASYGLWGMKTSHDSFDLTGVVPSVPRYDVLGILTRSADYLQRILALSSTSRAEKGYPKVTKIIYPTDWFPMANEAQQRMQDEFLTILEEYTGVKHTKVSLTDLWSSTAPEEHRKTTLSDYLKTSSAHPFYYDGYHVFDDFRAEYQEKFGKKPFVSPHVARRWKTGEETSKEERDTAINEIVTFRKWIIEQVLSPQAEGTIMMIPLGRPGNNPRYVVPPQPSGPETFAGYDLVPFATMNGIPQVIIPIGQNPYESPASGRTEHAPIVATLASVEGSDAFLLHVAKEALKKAGWPTEVLTGRYALPYGNSSRNTEDNASREKL